MGNMTTNETDADFTTLYQCVVCDEIFEQYTDLENHKTIHGEEEKTQQKDGGDIFHQCLVCDAIFEQFCDLENHNRIHVPVNVEEEEMVGDGFFQCNLCVDKFNLKKSDLETHSNMHMEKERSRGSTLHECTVFKMSMQPFSDIALHICACNKRLETDNKEENLFECDVCSKSFSRTVRLKVPKKLYVYKCTVCKPNIEFEEFCHLEAHREIHGICLHNGTFYQCNVCDNKFELYTDLEEHCKIHVQGEKDDDMDFKKENVDEGESAHIGRLDGEQNIQPYFDSEEHSYSNSSKYISAIDIMHIGMLEHSYCKREDWHRCIFCKEKFKQYGELQKHWKGRKCTGPEEVIPGVSHRCKFCALSFKLKIDCKKHLKTHSFRSVNFKTHSSHVKKLPTNIQYVKWL
ncbi:zinc finger protein 678 [Patella vulgata]|uniref:zinc finger protein 678 n=1 Tax=Patella vulgata TaxID=6465 RepID=UPI00217FA44C|nr:zinc finger protein 678 [Patella vulgata]